MCPATARDFRFNPLFRLLAFLDNTGTQSFVLDADLQVDGHFCNAELLFGNGTPIAGILEAALDALRANIRRLFVDAMERLALLAIVGAGAPDPTQQVSPWITAAAEPLAAMTDARSNAATVDECLTQPSASPQVTAWSEKLLHPTSLSSYPEDLENDIPLHLLVRLREVLGIPAPSEALSGSIACLPSPQYCCTSTPLVEQILIDGLDEWLRRCSLENVKRMVLACGVQPTVWASALSQSHEQQAPLSGALLPGAIVDFVVDVVFPIFSKSVVSESQSSTTSAQSWTPSRADGLQDWLILSYEKNREAIEVEEQEDEEASCSEDAAEEETRKRTRVNSDRLPELDEDASLGYWKPEDGEELLTADNIDRYMRDHPERVPKEILREKRKPICDATITAFELEHHYTAAELKALVKEKIGAMTVEEATELMQRPVSEDRIRQAARLTRKAQFVEWIIGLHGTTKSRVDS